MTLSISELYSEPGCYFSISYKVLGYISEILNDKIMLPHNIFEKLRGYKMSLMVSTNSQTKIVEVKGPSRDTRNKILTWGLWLPYEEIVRNDDERQAFIMYFFESIKMLFAKYDVTAEEISIVERQVRDVIVNNPNYYVEKELFEEIDLSDIDFD